MNKLNLYHYLKLLHGNYFVNGFATFAEVSAHTSNKANPHAVTKSQVGLGSVLNYGVSTQAEAQAGTSNAKYMTPLRTKEAITSQTSQLISDAKANTINQRDGSSVKMWIGTQAQYDAIATKDSTVMYMVTI